MGLEGERQREREREGGRGRRTEIKKDITFHLITKRASQRQAQDGEMGWREKEVGKGRSFIAGASGREKKERNKD